jgi:hypothetical protein
VVNFLESSIKTYFKLFLFYLSCFVFMPRILFFVFEQSI